MNISVNIKAIREGKRLSQAEVARRMEIAPEFYFRLEKREKKLSLEQIESIANALEVSVAELIGIDVSNTVDTSDEMGKLLKENEELKEKLNKFERIFIDSENLMIMTLHIGGMVEGIKELLLKKEELENSIDSNKHDIFDINFEIYEMLKSMIRYELRIKREDNNISDKWIEHSTLNFLVSNDSFLKATIGDEYKLLFNKEYHNFLYEFEKERKNKTLEI